MRRATKKNVNTAGYWDDVYQAEIGTGKQRIDSPRLRQLRRWAKIREHEREGRLKLLDAGCGPGEMLLRLRATFPDAELYGCDVSPIALGHASVTGERLQLEVASIGALPYADGMFDLVWCGETLEHLDDPDAAVADLARVTRPGGMLALSVPYRTRNTSDEHVWEFEPADIARWAKKHGELAYLNCRLLPGWLSMFAVIRVGKDARWDV